VCFYKYFKSLFIAIIITALLFIPWDIYFTSIGIWGFNKEHLTGVYFYNLPIEEWLFFITVPFSCTFIHYVIKTNIKNKVPIKITNSIWIIFSFILLLIGLFNQNQFYTSLAFILCSFAIFIVNHFHKHFMKDYLLTYLFCLIPFLIVNSILTGLFTKTPVVWYNENHIFGLRIGTIPIEDTVYNMLLLLLICFFTDFIYTFKKDKN
jgi:lycopene cyclase domain-containing protein